MLPISTTFTESFLVSRLSYWLQQTIWHTIMIVLGRGDNRNWTLARYFPVFFTVQIALYSFRLKFYNHLRNSSCSFLGICFATHASQRSEHVVQHKRRCFVIQWLIQKCVHNNKKVTGMERFLFVRLYIVDAKDRRILASSRFERSKFCHFHTVTSLFNRFSVVTYFATCASWVLN